MSDCAIASLLRAMPETRHNFIECCGMHARRQITAIVERWNQSSQSFFFSRSGTYSSVT